MYSPFSDSKGRPLTIEKIKFSHLSQLVDCDEGHHVEYKLLLEDGGKAQLAKEITSFANCEGGWLIVGIDDKTKEIKPIDKQDYSQRIGKIATRISPMPEFTTRFLTMPEIKNPVYCLSMYMKVAMLLMFAMVVFMYVVEAAKSQLNPQIEAILNIYTSVQKNT